MARGERMETLDDIKIHIAYRDGQIDSFMDEQSRTNLRNETTTRSCQGVMQKQIGDMRKDLKEMRAVIYKATGGAAMLGAIVGIVIAGVIQAVMP